MSLDQEYAGMRGASDEAQWSMNARDLIRAPPFCSRSKEQQSVRHPD
jgi:hypothetical protein